MDAISRIHLFRGVKVYFVLWLIRDVDCDVIQEEIATRIARHVNDPYAEVGAAEVAGGPCATPCVRYTSEGVSGFRCA